LKTACRSDEEYNKIQVALERLIDKITVLSIDSISFATSDHGDDLKSNILDRLLTMFWDRQRFPQLNTMLAVQFVDSPFVLTTLRQLIRVDAFKRAYDLSVSISNRALEGLLYERVIHQLLDEGVKAKTANITNIIREVCWWEGNMVDDLKQFVRTGMYWIPSIPNFENLDGAIVHKTTLHVFQYTISSKHCFNVNAFQSTFLPQILQQITGIVNVKAHFITPTTQGDWKWQGLNDPEKLDLRVQDSILRISYHMHQLVLYNTRDDSSVFKFFEDLLNH
jgi:hypothetical protein